MSLMKTQNRSQVVDVAGTTIAQSALKNHSKSCQKSVVFGTFSEIRKLKKPFVYRHKYSVLG